jgi:hypothetical protein
MKAKKNNKQREEILDMYLDRVLKKHKRPKSVHKFCKKCKIDETVFYNYFTSFEDIEHLFWSTMTHSTLSLIRDDLKSEQPVEHKLLNFYYTLFENFNIHKAPILIFLQRSKTNPFPEKELRKHIIPIIRTIAKEIKCILPQPLSKGSALLYSELMWFQFLSVLKFWTNDKSHDSEKTDMFIEKSIKLASEIHQSFPTETVLDYGKFMYKEIKPSL